MFAAVIAAFGAAISEVGAVIIVGGNFQGEDQTLGSALLAQFNYYGNVPAMIAIGLVLLALILVLIGMLTVLQQRAGGLQMRFRTELTMGVHLGRDPRRGAADLPRQPAALRRDLVHAPGRLRSRPRSRL